jgi:3-methyladenine DNA glycosylase/8-oxoguanine DNA glycosylase
MDSKLWYQQISEIKDYLVTIDGKLKILFDDVDKTGFQIHTVMKEPYPALVGAIIGQKISYSLAKKLRSELYTRYGTIFTPQDLYQKDLSFLGAAEKIIDNVTTYIVINNIDLSTEDNIRSLVTVNGIGKWTIDATLLTCLTTIKCNADNTSTIWDLFPPNDKFIEARMKKLYGANYDTRIIDAWSPFRSIVTWYLWRWF